MKNAPQNCPSQEQKRGTYNHCFLSLHSSDITPCDMNLFHPSVSFEKKYIYQGLLVVNWEQIHNQSLAVIPDRGLSCTLHFSGGEATDGAFNFLQSEPTLIREFLVLSFTETCPIQLKSCKYILICISIDQSKLLHNEQPKCMLTNQHCAFWPELQEFEFFICIKVDQSGTWVGTFSTKGSGLFVSAEYTFGFHQRLCFQICKPLT